MAEVDSGLGSSAILGNIIGGLIQELTGQGAARKRTKRREELIKAGASPADVFASEESRKEQALASTGTLGGLGELLPILKGVPVAGRIFSPPEPLEAPARTVGEKKTIAELSMSGAREKRAEASAKRAEAAAKREEAKGAREEKLFPLREGKLKLEQEKAQAAKEQATTKAARPGQVMKAIRGLQAAGGNVEEFRKMATDEQIQAAQTEEFRRAYKALFPKSDVEDVQKRLRGLPVETQEIVRAETEPDIKAARETRLKTIKDLAAARKAPTMRPGDRLRAKKLDRKASSLESQIKAARSKRDKASLKFPPDPTTVNKAQRDLDALEKQRQELDAEMDALIGRVEGKAPAQPSPAPTAPAPAPTPGPQAAATAAGTPVTVAAAAPAPVGKRKQFKIPDL